MAESSVRQLLKWKKRFDEARRRLARRLPHLSVEEIRSVLSSNTIEAILEGRLRVPEGSLARSINRALRDRFSEVVVTLEDRSLEVRGKYLKLGVEIDFFVRAVDQTYTPEPPPGVVTLTIEEMDVGAGGLPLRRLLSLIIVAVLRFLYGERLVHDQLEGVEGITLEEGLFTCRLAELPQVQESIDKTLLGVRLGDLIQVTDIKFVRGHVEVSLSVAEALEKAALLVDPMKRPGR